MKQSLEEQIMFKLGEISSQITDTNKHLEKLNGSVGRHENEIDEINQWKSNLSGKMTIWGSVGGVVITVVTIFIGWFLNKK